MKKRLSHLVEGDRFRIVLTIEEIECFGVQNTVYTFDQKIKSTYHYHTTNGNYSTSTNVYIEHL